MKLRIIAMIIERNKFRLLSLCLVFQINIQSMELNITSMEALQQQNRRRMAESSLEDLHDDLLVEILLRISDHKRLFQWKSVCKLWFSHISKTDFGCRYISLHPSMKKIPKDHPFTFIVHTDDDSSPKLIFSEELIFQSPGFSFNFLPFSSTIRIIETFNDLVLCCDSSENFGGERVYYICNPLTMEWTALPPAPSVGFVCMHICFICEPSSGIALNTQQRFKLVRVIYAMSDPNRICLHIFSSETGQWNQTALSLPQDLALREIFDVVACKNGAKLILLGLSASPKRLVSLTIEGENFDQYRRTLLPSDHVPCKSVSGLELSKRNLLLANLGRLYHLQIWELLGDGEWSLRVSDFIYDKIIELSSVDYRAEQSPIPSILGFHPYDRDVFYLNLYFNGRMASYDTRRRILNLVPNVILDKIWSRFYPFVLPFWPTPIPQISEL